MRHGAGKRNVSKDMTECASWPVHRLLACFWREPPDATIKPHIALQIVTKRVRSNVNSASVAMVITLQYCLRVRLL